MRVVQSVGDGGVPWGRAGLDRRPTQKKKATKQQTKSFSLSQSLVWKGPGNLLIATGLGHWAAATGWTFAFFPICLDRKTRFLYIVRQPDRTPSRGGKHGEKREQTGQRHGPNGSNEASQLNLGLAFCRGSGLLFYQSLTWAAFVEFEFLSLLQLDGWRVRNNNIILLGRLSTLIIVCCVTWFNRTSAALVADERIRPRVASRRCRVTHSQAARKVPRQSDALSKLRWVQYPMVTSSHVTYVQGKRQDRRRKNTFVSSNPSFRIIATSLL